jgi:hypothetical protein
MRGIVVTLAPNGQQHHGTEDGGEQRTHRKPSKKEK